MEKDYNWKEKFQDLLSTCQEELKKTTALGKKMLEASKKHGELKQSFEDLGTLVFKNIENDNWKSLEELTSNDKIKRLFLKIKTCESDLLKIEKVVESVKENNPSFSDEDDEVILTSKKATGSKKKKSRAAPRSET